MQSPFGKANKLQLGSPGSADIEMGLLSPTSHQASSPPALSSPLLPPPTADIENMSEDTIITYVALGRVVEALRFVIPDDRLDAPITEQNLLEISTMELVAFHDLAPDAPPPESLRLIISRLWARLAGGPMLRATYREMLAFDNPHYPVTSSKQREQLRRLSKRTVVSRDAVMQTLGIDDASHPLITNMFGKGDAAIEKLPGFVVNSLVKAMSVHPNNINFTREVSRSVTSAHRGLAEMLPYVVIFIVSAIVITEMHLEELYLAQNQQWWAMVAPWANGCPNGPDKPGCLMIRKDVPTGLDNTLLIDYYFRQELISQLWRTGDENVTKASETPLFGNWLVGSLQMRVSPIKDSPSRKLRTPNENDGCPVKTCAQLGLSEPISEFLLGTEFDCTAFNPSSFKSIVEIPFNTTRAEAKQMMREFTADFCEEESASAVIQWAMYQPSDGVMCWASISASVPKPGPVIPRAYVKAISGSTSKSGVTPKSGAAILFFMQLVITVWVCGVCILSSGAYPVVVRLFNTQVLTHVVMLIVVGIGYGLIVSASNPVNPVDGSPSQIKNFALQDWRPPRIDKIADQWVYGMDLLAVWTVLFFLNAMFLFKNVIDLSVVMRLLSAAAVDVVSLLIFFGFITLGFIAVARAIFGPVDKNFTSTTAATTFLLRIYFAGFSYDVMTEQLPIIGNLFYYFYVAFVIFFVLNILIAVIKFPLAGIKQSSNLHTKTYEKMEEDVANFTRSEFAWFGWRKRLLPVLNLIMDSLTFSKFTVSWATYEKIVSTLYDRIPDKPGINEIATAAYELIVFCDGVPPNSHWNTALWRAVERYKTLPHKPSRVLIKRTIMLQTSIEIFRDAALIRVLIAYDAMRAPLEKIVKQQEAMRDTFVKRSRKVAADAEKERGAAFTIVNNNPQTTSGGGGGGDVVQLKRIKASPFRKIVLENFGKDKKLQQNKQKQNKRASSSSPPSSPSQSPLSPPSLSVQQGGSAAEMCENDDDDDDDEEALDPTVTDPTDDTSKYKFFEHRFLVRHIRMMLLFPVLSCAVFALYLAFIVPLLSISDEEPYLGENILFLRDMAFETKCNDPNCTSGLLRKKTFNSISHIDDVSQYIKSFLIPMLFTPEDQLPFNIPGKFKNDTALGLSWGIKPDQYVRRTTPLTIRQLRSKKKIDCSDQLPGTGFATKFGISPGRVEAMLTNNTCFEALSVLDTGDADFMEDRPENSTLLPLSAYQYRERCVEGSSVQGYWTQYPCAGYSIDVYNSSQLLEIANVGKHGKGTWLSQRTRLLVISATFKSTYTGLNPTMKGHHINTGIDLYIELSKGAGSARKWAFITPGRQTLFEPRVWVPGTLLLVLELFIYLAKLVFALTLRFLMRRKAYSEHIWPETPFIYLGVMIALIVVQSLPQEDIIAKSTRPREWVERWQTAQRQSWVLALLAISATTSWLTRVIFPIAKLVTYRAAWSIRVMSLAWQSIGMLLPFYAVSYVGMSLGGHMIFGRQVFKFASVRLSAATIGRMVLKAFPFQEMFSERPLPTLLFIVCFFAVVIIILGNLLLATINGSVAAAHSENANVAFMQQTSDVLSKSLLTDEPFAVYLAWRLNENNALKKFFIDVIYKKLLQRDGPIKALRQFTVTEFGRFRRPSESLMFLFDTYSLREAAEIFKFRTFPQDMIRSLAQFLVKERGIFKQRFREQFNEDEKTERGEHLFEKLNPPDEEAEDYRPDGHGFGDSEASSPSSSSSTKKKKKMQDASAENAFLDGDDDDDDDDDGNHNSKKKKTRVKAMKSEIADLKQLVATLSTLSSNPSSPQNKKNNDDDSSPSPPSSSAGAPYVIPTTSSSPAGSPQASPTAKKNTRRDDTRARSKNNTNDNNVDMSFFDDDLAIFAQGAGATTTTQHHQQQQQQTNPLVDNARGTGHPQNDDDEEEQIRPPDHPWNKIVAAAQAQNENPPTSSSNQTYPDL